MPIPSPATVIKIESQIQEQLKIEGNEFQLSSTVQLTQTGHYIRINYHQSICILIFIIRLQSCLGQCLINHSENNHATPNQFLSLANECLP